MQITYNAFSQRGTGKPHNEDAVLLNSQLHQGKVRAQGTVDLLQTRYFAIADGVAIGTLPRTASRRLLELLQTRLESASVNACLSMLLHQVQQDYAALGEVPEFQGMASTLVGVRLTGSTATIFNTGDSRAYLLTHTLGNAPTLRLLSRDHSVLNDMLDAGEMTLGQARNAASILHSLSSQFVADSEFNEFKVHIATHALQAGERLVLCSDGLNEVLSDGEIAALLCCHSDTDLLNACKASRRAGGTDDFSVVVLSTQLV